MATILVDVISSIPAKQCVAILLVLSVLVLPAPFVLKLARGNHEYNQHNEVSFEVDPVGDSVVMGDAFENIIWFPHVTDIHYNVDNPDTANHFRAFLDEMNKLIRPPFILNTGDSTDATMSYPMDRRQMPKEWELYQKDLEEQGWYDPMTFIEVIGNHDAMSSGNPWSSKNHFFKVSPIGQIMHTPALADQHPHITVYDADRIATVTYPMVLNNITFVLLNTPEINPGFTVPANFYGNVHPDQLAAVHRVLNATEESGGPVISMSHQSTRWVQSQSLDSKHFHEELSKKHLSLHLAGHMHRWGFSRFGKHHTPEIVTTRFGHQHVTWLAMDHGMLAAQSARYRSPVLVVTNPKPAHMLSKSEPLHRIRQSTHVRMLLLYVGTCPDPADMTLVVAGDTLPVTCQKMPADYAHARPAVPSGGSDEVLLLTAPWTPTSLDAGTHILNATITISSSREISQAIEFSVDGTAAALDTLHDTSPFTWLDYGNTVNTMVVLPQFWALVQIATITTILLLACLPIRPVVQQVVSDTRLKVTLVWRRSRVLLGCVLVFSIFPAVIAQLNGEDWAFLMSYGIVCRSTYVFDPFLVSMWVAYALSVFVPATFLFIITASYTAIVEYRHHMLVVETLQVNSKIMVSRHQEHPRRRRLYLMFDALVAAVVLGLFAMLIIGNVGAFYSVYNLWCRDRIIGMVSFIVSPALLPMQSVIVLACAYDIAKGVQMRWYSHDLM